MDDDTIDGTAGEGEPNEPNAAATADLTTGTTATATTATATDKGGTAAPPDFTDPAKLPPELQPLAKKLQASYTKKMQRLSEASEKAGIVDRFEADPTFATNLIMHHAQRLGLTVTRGSGQGTDPMTTTQGAEPPAHLVETITARLAPELQWLAKDIAAAGWESAQAAVAPLAERTRQQERVRAGQEIEAATAKLAELAPGWEEHEDDMNELLEWLTKGKNIQHPRFGTKMEFLYNAVAKNGAAEAAAIRRMSEAGKHATRTGTSTRSTTANISDRVRKAATSREAFQIAQEEAERELRERGIELPN